MQAGLVLRLEDAYTFLHDRVQEAAYSLIPQDARAAAHLRIGRILSSSLTPEAIAERIFEVVNQLNRGSELVESQEERERIAELDLLAGQRAKAATAYASALRYLAAGAALLAEDRWERRYGLAFSLDLHRAECEFLTGAREAAEERLEILWERAESIVDQAAVTCLRVELVHSPRSTGPCGRRRSRLSPNAGVRLVAASHPAAGPAGIRAAMVAARQATRSRTSSTCP